MIRVTLIQEEKSAFDVYANTVADSDGGDVNVSSVLLVPHTRNTFYIRSDQRITLSQRERPAEVMKCR